MLEHLCLQRPLAVVDLETTGTNPAYDRILEIAIVRLIPGQPPVSLVRRVNPGIPVPQAATEIHGITSADVADCPCFPALARGISRLLEEADLSGFNLRRIDLPFLMAEFQRAKEPFSLEGRFMVDVLQIFHEREPRNLAAALQFYCNRVHTQAHSAAADVWVTIAILDAQLGRYADVPRTVEELHRRQIEVDVAGWFRQVAGKAVFAVGKHRGKSLLEVARDAPDYLHWMLSQTLLPDARVLVEQALRNSGEPA